MTALEPVVILPTTQELAPGYKKDDRIHKTNIANRMEDNTEEPRLEYEAPLMDVRTPFMSHLRALSRKNLILSVILGGRDRGFSGFLPSSISQIGLFNGTTEDFDQCLLNTSLPDLFGFIFRDLSVDDSRLSVIFQFESAESPWTFRNTQTKLQLLSSLFTTLGTTNVLHANCTDPTQTQNTLRYFSPANPPFSIKGYHGFYKSTGDSKYSDSASVITTIFLFVLPFLLWLSIPSLTYVIVVDKKTRSIEMMKIMGLSMTAYWTSTLAFSFILNVITATIIVIIGVSCKLPFFFLPNVASYIILLLLSSIAQPTFGMMCAAFFSQPRTAGIVMSLSSLSSAGFVFLNLMVTPMEAPAYLMWLTPFSMIRGVFVISSSIIDPNRTALSFSDIWHGELVQVYAWLIGMSIINFLATLYLHNILPQDHGTREPFLFPIYHMVDLFTRHKRMGNRTSLLGGITETTPLKSRASSHEDGDILVVDNIEKKYPGKIALRGVSLTLSDGECLGLLGPNGAGKSTLAHILCGILPPSGGSATIAGYDIFTHIHAARKVMGFCPQSEIVWQEMTVEEHLIFYIRIKGISKYYEDEECDRILSLVGLISEKKKRSSALSGGMKRRMAIAISLIGSPKCLILDEPTTGLDPDTRRSIWELIQRLKRDRAIVLTTHNMEEADVLASKIAIVADGLLVCMGSPLELKRQYGRGYRLSISARPSQLAEAELYVMEKYPRAVRDPVSGNVAHFYLPTQDVDLSSIFVEMKRDREKSGIEEWGISQASMEEVFLKIMRHKE
ncbi:hypothetical protein PROFUN_09279 [Planoprotostelium fungivorum]|uniref:ABC transporter domain-containing protein n=1 Tax=Planoprotostelium fungivorum TaxID=1890364 RepID=A0A2P6NKZ8_9EUKA|nr:hypothetical protein PROFUN_09279 [Planoprotostelium fungivorum]